MSVTKLEDKNATPDEEVVNALKDALALAEEGRLRSVVLAGNLTGSQTFSTYSTHDLVEAIGLTSLIHHRLCARLRENRGD